MIPSYESGPHLADALTSVLAQDPGPDAMQIEVVDDGSQNDPTPLVRQLCGDRVAVHRHTENRGHVATFNTCLERAQGELVHLLHDDDVVREGFYDRLGAALGAHPEVGAAFCRYIVIDDDGNWLKIASPEQATAGVIEGWLERIAMWQRLQAVCMVVRKRVYDAVGGFDPRIRSYGEDWEMWTRIAAHYPVWYEPEPLALYRLGNSSLSSSALRTGDNVRQLLQVIEINRARLPPDAVARVTARARREVALTAVQRALRFARSRDLRSAAAQLAWAVRADSSPGMLGRVAWGSVRAASAYAELSARRRLAPFRR
jgi:GT2 family glycosyltransferase